MSDRSISIHHTNIPDGWKLVNQGEVATFYNGRAYKLSEWELSGTPVIRLQNLTGSGEKYYYSNLELPEHQYCYPGDLLYMWSATFGAVWWKGNKAIYHYHIWKIEVNEKVLNKTFHYYLLNDITDKMKNESHGSTMLHVTKGGMEKFILNLPPITEQEKIVEILSAVDAKINLITSQVIETNNLKEGLMERLFTYGTIQRENSDAVLGKLPEGWSIGKIEDVSTVIDSLHQTPTFSKDGYPMVRISDIKGRYLKFDTCLKVDDTIFKEFTKKYKPKRGDILISRVGTFGATVFVNTDTSFCLGQNTAVITPNIDSHYVYYYLNSSIARKLMLSSTNGSSQMSLSLKDIRQLKILVPPLSEQKKISQILTVIDDKLDILLAKNRTYLELKNGLMQQLLTGKIRVSTYQQESAVA